MLGAVELTPEELRVLGCLVEKQLTTPQQYPLTLNALVLACNQSSNRDPVVAYDEQSVEQAVTRAKERGLARFVHPSHGRSALRYRHELDAYFGLEARQLALLAVLALRGPQTPGELRARTERMARFSDLAEIEAELDALARREEPLVVRLPRQPGRKEDRFAHALGALATAAAGSDVPEPFEARAADGVRRDSASSSVATMGTGLAAEVATLRAEVAELRRLLDDLRAQLGV
jgi:uncharacterized protein YceH (UPF0502 family)